MPIWDWTSANDLLFDFDLFLSRTLDNGAELDHVVPLGGRQLVESLADVLLERFVSEISALC